MGYAMAGRRHSAKLTEEELVAKNRSAHLDVIRRYVLKTHNLHPYVNFKNKS